MLSTDGANRFSYFECSPVSSRGRSTYRSPALMPAIRGSGRTDATPTTGRALLRETSPSMVTHDRNTRSRSLRIESLESRNLLSLIGSKPTLDVVDGPGVHHHRGGTVFITQPATIQVVGNAQPGAPGTTTEVSI